MDRIGILLSDRYQTYFFCLACAKRLESDKIRFNPGWEIWDVHEDQLGAFGQRCHTETCLDDLKPGLPLFQTYQEIKPFMEIINAAAR